MLVNVRLCHFVELSTEYPYTVDSSVLERVESFVDLGVVFDPKLTFNRHIDMIFCKANSRFGMIKRWSRDFNDPFVTKTLFVSLVRRVLEFACHVWCPYYKCHIERIESIQKQFLLFALSNLNWNHRYQLPKYEHRLMLLDMNTLEDRRKTLNSIFIFKLLSGDINCNYLLDLCKIKCPNRILRNFCLLYTPHQRQTYLNIEPS